MSTIRSENIQDFGLTQVFCPVNPLVDVVLVHGLNGHPYHTWTAKHGKAEIFWPRDLLPAELEEEQCRILVYGYDANVATTSGGASSDYINHHADTFAQKLDANRRRRARKRPLIFVCHSLGGLVVKRMMIACAAANLESQEGIKSCYVSCHGIIFLGTPHKGSDLAAWGSILRSICNVAVPRKFVDTQEQLVKSLEKNCETLQVISHDFLNIKMKFYLYCFYESKPMDMKSTYRFVVEKDSAAPDWEGAKRAGIEKDHSNMCKFESKHSTGFDLVSYAIQDCAAQAPSKIAVSWQAETRDQMLRREDHIRGIIGDNIDGLRNSTLLAGPGAMSKGTSIESSISSLRDRRNVTPSRVPDGPLMVAPVGFRPNSIFKGFDMQLTRMNQLLQDPEKAQLGTVSILLRGLTGFGKTHLARQYVWMHRTDHPAGTFWVDCTTDSSRFSGYRQIGLKLGCLDENINDRTKSDREVVDTVREKLEEMHGWILVFDAMQAHTSADLDAWKSFIPNSPGNKIILTTVNRYLEVREKLLRPTPVFVDRLLKKDALALLYAHLDIDLPTDAQKLKASELVKQCKYWPLGILTEARNLRHHKRKLEDWFPKFIARSYGAYTSILNIFRTLGDGNHPEAMSLVTILSLLFHRVPVALLRFGIHFLVKEGVIIESMDPTEDITRSLDRTIAVLVSRGLLERESELIDELNYQDSSPESTRKSTVSSIGKSSQSHILIKTNEAKSFITGPNSLSTIKPRTSRSVIDVLKMHNVMQRTIRRDLKSYDRNNYLSWLVIACRFLAASYVEARSKSESFPGYWAIEDTEQYQMHSDALLHHLAPLSRQRPDVAQAEYELKEFRESLSIDRRQSPTQSMEGAMPTSHPRSIFEEIINSSEESPNDDDIYPVYDGTWSLNLHRPTTESPIDMKLLRGAVQDFSTEMIQSAGGVNALVSYPPNNSQRKASISKGTDERLEEFNRQGGRSGTDKSATTTESSLPRYHPSKRRDLGEFRPKPIIDVQPETAIATQVKSPSSSPARWWQFPFRRSSSQSLAEKSLASFRGKNAVPSRTLFGTNNSENEVAVEITDPEDHAEFMSQGSLLAERSPNLHLAGISTGLQHRQNPPKVAQIARTSTTSPRLLASVLMNKSTTEWGPGLSWEDNVSLVRYDPGVNILPQPYQLPQENLDEDVPQGYYSSVPMSREASSKSQRSFASLPTRPASAIGSPMTSHIEQQMAGGQRDRSIGAVMERGLSVERHIPLNARLPYPTLDDPGQLIELDQPQGSSTVMPTPQAFNNPHYRAIPSVNLQSADFRGGM